MFNDRDDYVNQYNMRLGPIMLRQLRVTNDSCNIDPHFEHVVKNCTKEYSLSREDITPFYTNVRYPRKYLE